MRQYHKPYRIKKTRPFWRNRFFLPATLFLLAIVGLVYFLFFSGIFEIKKIEISGLGKVSEEGIVAIVPQGNIFLIDTGKIKKDILGTFPQIAEARIRRSFPASLSVSITERSPIALWCEQEKCFLIDKDGAVIEQVSAETDLIKIFGAKDALNQQRIGQLMELRGKLERLGIITTQFSIVSEERLNVKTSEGWQIYFNLHGDEAWQLQELVLVLEKQISPQKRKNLEYIDLRFSRVYYR